MGTGGSKNTDELKKCRQVKKYTNGLYVGELKDNKRHGKGRMMSANGDIRICNWKDDKCHGQGTLMYYSGSVFTGEWKNGKLHGQGTHTWPDGGKYVGNYQDNKRHGQGICTWPDGEKYVGGYQHGKRHGQGTSTLLDGTRYVGGYKDGKIYGNGVITRCDGAYTGICQDGHGTYTRSDGRVRIIVCKDGTVEIQENQVHGQSTLTDNRGETEALPVLAIQENRLRRRRVPNTLVDSSRDETETAPLLVD